ncbi:MAG: hypothetical protein AAGG46_04985 [Planctomycetota bacterium]
MPRIDPRNIEVVDPLVIEPLRKMSGRESLRQALASHDLGRQLVESGVRAQHPDWPDEDVKIEVLRRMHGDAVAALAIRCRDA